MRSIAKIAGTSFATLALTISVAPAVSAGPGGNGRGASEDRAGKEAKSEEPAKGQARRAAKSEAKRDAPAKSTTSGSRAERTSAPKSAKAAKAPTASATVQSAAVTPTSGETETVDAVTAGCAAGTTAFKVESPSNGTFGPVTISGLVNDGFSWSSTEYVSSVVVKGGPGALANPGGFSGYAVSPINDSTTGRRYGVSHIVFCMGGAEGGDGGDALLPLAPIVDTDPLIGGTPTDTVNPLTGIADGTPLTTVIDTGDANAKTAAGAGALTELRHPSSFSGVTARPAGAAVAAYATGATGATGLDAQVLGVTIERDALARTGSPMIALLAIGLALLAFGSLVRGSARRRPARSQVRSAS